MKKLIVFMMVLMSASAFAKDCTMRRPISASNKVLDILSSKFDLVTNSQFMFSLELSEHLERQTARGFYDSVTAYAFLRLSYTPTAHTAQVVAVTQGSAINTFAFFTDIQEKALRRAARDLPNCKRGEI